MVEATANNIMQGVIHYRCDATKNIATASVLVLRQHVHVGREAARSRAHEHHRHRRWPPHHRHHPLVLITSQQVNDERIRGHRHHHRQKIAIILIFIKIILLVITTTVKVVERFQQVNNDCNSFVGRVFPNLQQKCYFYDNFGNVRISKVPGPATTLSCVYLGISQVLFDPAPPPSLSNGHFL